MEVVVTTGAISRAMLQSNHQQTAIQFFTSRMPFLSPNQQCQSTEGKNIAFHGLLTPSSPGVFQLSLWPLIAPGYIGEGLPCLSSALSCQYPIRFLELLGVFSILQELMLQCSCLNSVRTGKCLVDCFRSRALHLPRRYGLVSWPISHSSDQRSTHCVSSFLTHIARVGATIYYLPDVLPVIQPTQCQSTEGWWQNRYGKQKKAGRFRWCSDRTVVVQCQSTEGKISHSMDLLTPSSPGGLPTLSLTTNSSW